MPSPQGILCTQDCAQQACLKIALEALQFTYTLPMASAAYQQAMALVEYLNSHTNDCRDAILANNLCDETTWTCAGIGPYFRTGVYEIPDSEDWEDFTDVRIEAQCEINDWAVGDPVEACNGVQGNNADPFPDPVSEDPLIPFVASSATMGFATTVGTSPVSAVVYGTDLVFRQAPSCTAATCPFRLDKAALATSSIDLGDVQLADVSAIMVATADGTISGTTATFPIGEIKLSVIGYVQSTPAYPLLDDLPFSWVVVNDAAVTITVTSSTSLAPTLSLASAASFTGG